MEGGGGGRCPGSSLNRFGKQASNCGLVLIRATLAGKFSATSRVKVGAYKLNRSVYKIYSTGIL